MIHIHEPHSASVMVICLTGADPYCIIICEGKKVRTPAVNDSVNPEWYNGSAIFYRKKLAKSIEIEVGDFLKGNTFDGQFGCPSKVCLMFF